MTQRKLPKTVLVLGTPFRQVFSSTDAEGKPWETPDNKSYGETDGNERMIRYNPNQTADQLHSTRVHELCHAILHCAGLAELLDEKVEEAIVVALEHGIAPLMRFK